MSIWVLYNDEYESRFASHNKTKIVKQFLDDCVIPYFEANPEIREYLPTASDNLVEYIQSGAKLEQVIKLNDIDIRQLLGLFDDWKIVECTEL